jgi:toxin ParE1/3/4
VVTRRRTVVLTPRAFDDIKSIRDYLIEHSPQGAENVRRAINATLAQLSEFPFTGRDRPELGVRSVGVARYPYTIYHRVDETEVEIVHVRDDRRRPPAAADVT